jgi:hypothetical protein
VFSFFLGLLLLFLANLVANPNFCHYCCIIISALQSISKNVCKFFKVLFLGFLDAAGDKAANAYIKLANCQLKVSLLPLCIRRCCDLGCPPFSRFRVHKGHCFYLQIAVLIV